VCVVHGGNSFRRKKEWEIEGASWPVGMMESRKGKIREVGAVRVQLVGRAQIGARVQGLNMGTKGG
jgi:hypothetical protein